MQTDHNARAPKRRWLLRLILALILIAAAVAAAFIINRYIEMGVYKLNYPELIVQNSKKYELDPYLVAAIIHVESGNQPGVSSPKGAIGLMQVMPDTGKWIAEKLDEEFRVDMLKKPEVNVRFGCWYLRFLREVFDNDETLVLCAYNAGQGNVGKWLKSSEYSADGENLDKIPFPETEKYVERVRLAYAKYKKLYPDELKTGDTEYIDVDAAR